VESVPAISEPVTPPMLPVKPVEVLTSWLSPSKPARFAFAVIVKAGVVNVATAVPWTEFPAISVMDTLMTSCKED
jgi:hypothetical protein